jgi:GNAT superfamily N-acetyltransferase
MALTDAPADLATGIEVRRIETYGQFVAAREVQWTAFETPEDRRATIRSRLRQDFEDSMRHEVPVGFLATLDGKPAATALAVPSDRGVFLIAGATAPWARGRGLYRALVRARWDYAVTRGTPALITHANPDTSYAILKRLGFVDVCTIRRLEEPD